MKKVRNIALRLLFVALSCLVLLGASELLLSRLVNLEVVQKTVFDELRWRIHCETEYTKIDFTLFPRPHVIVRQARIWRPGMFDISLKSMTLYPELVPLLSGELRIREMAFIEPDIRLSWPESTPEQPDEESLDTLLQKTLSHFSSLDLQMATHLEFLRLTPIAPRLKIQDGRLTVTRNGESLFVFEHLQAHGERRPGHVELFLGGESSLCERISLQASIDLEEGASNGQLILVGARLDALGPCLLGQAPVRLGASSSSFALEYAYHQHKGMDFTLQGEFPELILFKNGRTIRFAGARFDAGLSLQGQNARITLDSLQMDVPRLNASGAFTYEGKGRDIHVEVEGRGVDAEGVRTVALGLWEEEKSVRETFEVLQGGFVPVVRYRVNGRTFKDLKRLESSVIEGTMENGRIYIPPADLEVEAAEGDVAIVGGILDAWNLKGKSGDSRAKGGFLKLALKKDANKDGPFHLDLQMDADLSRLPPVLRKTVKAPDFQEELALMKDVGGRASGRLVLGERLKDVKTRVEAQTFDLHGRYGRVPYPFQLKGTGFRFEGEAVSVEALEGEVGRSSFEPLALAVDWGEASQITVESGSSAQLILDEVYPWLTSFPRIQRALKGMEALGGRLIIQGVSLHGPFRYPEQWQYSVKASADGLRMRHTFFPDVVQVKSGQVQSTPGNLAFTDCRIDFLDAALAVSGSLTLSKDNLSSADLKMDGIVTPGAIDWVSLRIALPAEFRIQGPVSLSGSRLTWLKDRLTRFSGGIVKAGGVRGDLNLQSEPEELNIASLKVKDPESEATCSVVKNSAGVNLLFDGSLHGSTLDRLFVRNTLLTGSMQGKFQAAIHPDEPMSSTAKGSLEVQGLKMAWKTGLPLEIRKASLGAEGHRLVIRSALFHLAESEMNLEGTIDCSSEGYRLDLDLAASTLVWEKLREFREKELRSPEPGDAGSPFRSGSKGRSVTGTVRVRADHLSWGEYQSAPAVLTVTLRPEGMSVDFSEVSICGVSCPGKIEVSQQEIHLAADLVAREAGLDESILCLWGKRGLIDGTYQLEGALSAAGSGNDLISSLRGRLEFKARDGRILPIGFIGKLFSVLNITEIYRGQIPDLANKGCAYDSITAEGVIQDGVLSLDNSIVNAQCMKMVWKGTVDLRAKKLDLIVVVAPLRTVDRIIDKVPILGDILNGTLISFPVRVSGDLNDPDVIPLSPSALGSGFIDFLKRTITTPFRLTEPLRSGHD
jgi:hypothetical protein